MKIKNVLEIPYKNKTELHIIYIYINQYIWRIQKRKSSDITVCLDEFMKNGLKSRGGCSV